MKKTPSLLRTLARLVEPKTPRKAPPAFAKNKRPGGGSLSYLHKHRIP